MKFGLCGGPNLANVARDAGLDYFEWTVGALLQPRNEFNQFRKTLEEVKKASLPCPVVNVFIPGDLKITGSEVDESALEEFVKIAMDRAELAGVEVIVFGSGGARSVPENFNHQAAYQQLLQFGHMVAGHAKRCGVTIAVEPLNRKECNILNSVSECAEYVREIDHPNVRLLVDAYHMLLDDDPLESILEAKDLLIHAHIATPANRLPPGVEDFDFSPFLSALRQSGYAGRLSIEARLNEADLENELRNAAKLMRQ